MNPIIASQPIEAPLEVLQPSALESLERAQVDVQISTAHRFPRSLEQFRKRAMDMVQQDIETAESCIYSRPVGKGDDGKQKYAEGASIRMAEIVAACYGNIRVGARIIEQTERYVKAEGVAHDLESNYAAKSEAMEATVKRNGQPYDERMRVVVAKAALSKALRDAVFRVVPKALCKSVYDAAQKVIAGQNKTIEQRRKAAQAWLLSLRVDDHRAFAVLGVKGWSEVGEEQLLTLTGLKTALKDNDITLDEAFPATKSAVAPPAPSQPTAQTTTTAPVPPTAPPPADPQNATTDDGDLGPAKSVATCKYCKAEVENMVTHECEQMKQAKIAAALKQPMDKTPPAAPAAGEPQPLDVIKSLALQAGVSEAAVFAFAKRNKFASEKTERLEQLADAKLTRLAQAWPDIADEIQKIHAELNPAS